MTKGSVLNSLNSRQKERLRLFCHHYYHRVLNHSHEYVFAGLPVVIDAARFLFPVTCTVVVLVGITALQVIHEDMK